MAKTKKKPSKPIAPIAKPRPPLKAKKKTAPTPKRVATKAAKKAKAKRLSNRYPRFEKGKFVSHKPDTKTKSAKKVAAKKAIRSARLAVTIPDIQKAAARGAKKALSAILPRQAKPAALPPRGTYTFTLRNDNPGGDARSGKWFAEVKVPTTGRLIPLGPYARAERARGAALAKHPGALELTADGSVKAKGAYSPRKPAQVETLPSLPIPIYQPPAVGEGDVATDQDRLLDTAHDLLEKERKAGMAP